MGLLLAIAARAAGEAVRLLRPPRSHPAPARSVRPVRPARSATSGRDPGPATRRGDRGEHGVGAVHRRAVARRSISTSTGGMSMARRMPKERMVRSWTVAVGVDRQALGGHPAQRHVRGADGVGAQHDLVERLAAAHPHRARGRRAATDGRRPSPRPAVVTVSGPSPSDGQQHRRLGPAGGAERGRGGRARRRRPRRPRPGRERRADGVGDAAVRATCTTPVPSGRNPAASGGRLGPRRTQSSRASRTRTARPCSSARRPGRGRRHRGGLAAEGAAVGQRAGRLAAGPAPAGVGLEVGGLDPRRLQRRGPSRRRAPRSGARARPWCAAPAPCPPRPGPRPASRPPTQPPRPSGTATRASAGARSSAKPASPSTTAGSTCWSAPPSIVARRPPPPRPDHAVGTGSSSAPASPSRTARRRRRPGRRPRGWSASRCTGTGGRQRPVDGVVRRSAAPSILRRAGPRGARRCPGCRSRTGSRPVAQKASAHAVAPSAVEPVERW